ncbi:MAG TPA: ABC transporter ATP-binding protein [Acidimicrobiia bacterium]|jgi:branched-chain amino acid transport system ATP-binding protein|nr:ABC transporter ATP-binding protein [Acidimicrobiia bacterium]
MLVVTDLDVFYGDAQALWGVSIEVGEGEVVSIVGANGAGKSTFVNAVMGINQARRGSLVYDGVELANLPGHRTCRQGISIVPEGRRIFPGLSVQDNLDLGAFNKEARGQHRESIEWVHELFPRLAERRSQLAGSLSGGEQQMVAIGRALMARPRLLLMDEPSLGLAPVIVDEVFKTIENVHARGVSVVLVEQNIKRAFEISSRAYVLAEGRIVRHGPAAELATSPEVVKTLLGV